MTEKNFEDVFKDKLNHFEADVNPSVWQSVQSGLAGKGAAVSGASGASQAAGTFAGLGAKGMLFIAGAALVAGVGLYYVLGNRAPAANPAADAGNTTQTEKPVETATTDNQPVVPAVSDKKEVVASKETHTAAANKVPVTSGNLASHSNAPANPVATATVPTASTEIQKKEEPAVTPHKTDAMQAATALPQVQAAAPQEKVIQAPAAVELVFDTIENHLLGTRNGDTRLPNKFTPDGDGYNDVFTLQTTGLKTLEVTIFLHGAVVTKWNSLDGSWNGLLPNGKEAEAGTYYYSVKAVTSEDKICIAQSMLILSR